jgi:hypothetical protein
MLSFTHRFAVVYLGAALSLSLPGQSSASDETTCKPLQPMQAAVVEHADKGVDALRRYVFISRGIHQLDMMEVAGSLDAWRAEARCARQVAERAAKEVPVALQTRP